MSESLKIERWFRAFEKIGPGAKSRCAAFFKISTASLLRLFFMRTALLPRNIRPRGCARGEHRVANMYFIPLGILLQEPFCVRTTPR
jgi:hypothetical protein